MSQRKPEGIDPMTVETQAVDAPDRVADPLPSVSVVIPAYNRPDYLAVAVESALAQTVRPIEVIVIDDCSSVDLWPAVSGFGNAVRYGRLENGRGACFARNRGISLATGDVVGFLDDDDAWMPEKTERQLAALTQGAEAAVCGYNILHDPGRLYVQSIERVDEDLLRLGNHFCGSSGLIAWRSVLLETWWDDELPNGQDWDIFIRLAKRAPLAYVAEPLFRFRREGQQSIVSTSIEQSPEDLLRTALVAEKHRAWLGEPNYRLRLAVYLLRFLGRRRSKLPFVWHAIKRAGVVPTLHVLYRKFRGRDSMPKL